MERIVSLGKHREYNKILNTDYEDELMVYLHGGIGIYCMKCNELVLPLSTGTRTQGMYTENHL